MAVLLIAEHDNTSLKDATHKALTAVSQMLRVSPGCGHVGLAKRRTM